MRGTREAKRLFPLASPNVPRSTKPILRGVDWWQQENYFFFPVKSLHKGEPDSEYDDEMKDERCVRRQTIAREKGASFSYAYECGNGWRQRVTGEDSRPRIENALVPRCLDGKRACPEEECGGIDDYQHLIEALRDRCHPEH